MRNLLAVSAFLAACVSIPRLAAAETGLREGQFFPSLRLPALASGKLSSISEFRGKKILLFVFGSW